MAKKIMKSLPKKIKRTSSMEKCLQDAEDFLKALKIKKIVKTRTMMQTIQEGKKIVNKPKSSTIKSRAKRPLKKIPARIKTKRSLLVRPAISSSIGTTTVREKCINKFILPSTATVFRKSSKDNLPLPAFGFIDVCFCLDATGSMQTQLNEVQNTICSIIKKIESKVRTQGITLRFAIVSYRDHPPQESSYVTLIKDFTDAIDAIKYVNILIADGGGDQPQAVHDGLIDCCQKLNWIQMNNTPILRYIFHIADAPPHGKQFKNHGQKEGCLCGKTTQQVINEINKMQIHYRLIKAKANERLDQMQKIFKKSIVNMDSTQLSSASQMDIRVSDMIIHQILPQA